MKSKLELIIGDWLLTSVLSKTKIETLSNKLIIVTAQQQPQPQQQNNHNYSWVETNSKNGILCHFVTYVKWHSMS